VWLEVASVYPHSVAYPYISSSTFVAGSGPIFLTHLNCIGTEQTLLNCSSSYPYPYYYSHGSDVWMRCEHRHSGEVHYTSRNYCQLVILWLAHQKPIYNENEPVHFSNTCILSVADLEGFHGFHRTPLLKGCLWKYYVQSANVLRMLYPHTAWECWFPPRLTWITSCFAASATRSAVTPLIPETQQQGLVVGLSSNLFSSQNYTRNNLRGSEIQKFLVGHACPQTPPSRRAKRTLIASWNPSFQILDPPLIVIDYLHIPLQWIVPSQ